MDETVVWRRACPKSMDDRTRRCSSERTTSAMNPTEKSALQKDVPWIYDISATPSPEIQIAFLFDANKLPELAEGEAYHCEFCGARFGLWPVSDWASHVMDTHRDALTLQQSQAIMQLCSTGLTDHTKQFLTMQLMTRVNLRRRAQQLDMLVFLDGNGNPIPAPKVTLQ